MGDAQTPLRMAQNGLGLCSEEGYFFNLPNYKGFLGERAKMWGVWIKSGEDHGKLD